METFKFFNSPILGPEIGQAIIHVHQIGARLELVGRVTRQEAFDVLAILSAIEDRGETGEIFPDAPDDDVDATVAERERRAAGIEGIINVIIRTGGHATIEIHGADRPAAMAALREIVAAERAGLAVES